MSKMLDVGFTNYQVAQVFYPLVRSGPVFP